jgi:hypothetical protein
MVMRNEEMTKEKDSKFYSVCEIILRVWKDICRQDLKYFDEISLEDISTSFMKHFGEGEYFELEGYIYQLENFTGERISVIFDHLFHRGKLEI